MDQILSYIQGAGLLLLVILVFNLIIVVHELGHFLAARWRGLEVEKFQIWFGKPLWKKTINGVQYGLGSIPAGGFVALPQMAPMELLEGKSNADGKPLKPIPPIDKIIVAFAGPLFSFGLAFVIACFVWVIGYPASIAGNSTVVGVVMPGPAADAGILPADEIRSIDGQKVNTFGGMVDSVQWSIMSGRSDTIEIELMRDGKLMTVQVEAPIPELDPLVPWWKRLFSRPPLRAIGIGPVDVPIIFGKMTKNGPADQAGLKRDDELVEFNGEKLLHFRAMTLNIREQDFQPVNLKVKRGQDLLEFTVTPRRFDDLGDYTEEDYPNPILGIAPADPSDPEVFARETYSKHPKPWEIIPSTLRMMYNTVTAVASPKSGVKPGHMSGPAGIINVYFELLKSPQGWKLVLWFSVILNINLAVLNMLPLPILDGGHITVAIIEGLSRRAIHIRVLEVANLGCAVLLIGFMLYVTKFDAGDIFRMNQKAPEPPSFNPPTATASVTAPTPG